MKQTNRNYYYSNNNVMSFPLKMWWFIITIGGRGVGKTFSAWNYIIKKFLKRNKKFVWLRLTDGATKQLLANGGQNLVPQELLNKYKISVTTRGTKVFFNGKYAGEVLALSNSHNQKGYYLNAEQKKKVDEAVFRQINKMSKVLSGVFLDEFNREKDEKKTFDISNAIHRQIESLVRDDKVRWVFLGNTIDEVSDVLATIGFTPKEYGIYKIPNKHTIIEYVPDKPGFAEARKERMANVFAADSDVDMSTQLNYIVATDTRRVLKPSEVIRPRFFARLWLRNTIAYDIYTHAGGIWLRRIDKHPDEPKKQYVILPHLISENRMYSREMLTSFKDAFLSGRFYYEDNALAIAFTHAFADIIKAA